MALMILFGCLAFWGAVNVIWTVLGWLLPKAPTMLLYLCPDNRHPDGAIARYCWLRSLGLIRGKLVIFGQIPQKEQDIWKKKYPNVEFLTVQELPAALELERTI